KRPVCYRHGVHVRALDRSLLPDAVRVLEAACDFDQAARVADEKLFGPGPSSVAQPFGAWLDDDLVGVAAVAGDRLRLLAVDPGSRGRGVGSALLDRCVAT